MKLYKILEQDGRAIYGVGSWNLPDGDSAGEWMPAVGGDLVVCQNGYHLARPDDLLTWLGPRIFEAEYDGEIITGDDKAVVRRARLLRETNWNKKTARLFACDCAERVLHIFEKQNPDDSRVRNCIETARKVANGDLPISELFAAWDAAGAAAGAAAGNAAGNAAWAAAWAAARDAARNGGWSAAWDAARAATWAGGWSAAWDAAGDAAGDAAKDAEKQWQTTRLLEYLEGTQ